MIPILCIISCNDNPNPPLGLYQAVQLGHGALASRLADVPDLDTSLAPGVNVAGGVADRDGAHHFSVAQRVNLACVAWDARADQSIWRKRDGLHLTVCADVERVCSVWREMCAVSLTGIV